MANEEEKVSAKVIDVQAFWKQGLLDAQKELNDLSAYGLLHDNLSKFDTANAIAFGHYKGDNSKSLLKSMSGFCEIQIEQMVTIANYFKKHPNLSIYFAALEFMRNYEMTKYEMFCKDVRVTFDDSTNLYIYQNLKHE